MGSGGRAGKLCFPPPGGASIARQLDGLQQNTHIYCALLDLPTRAEGMAAGESKMHMGAACADIWSIDRFGKPVISLIRGIVDWTEFAFAVNGTHKVADLDATFTVRAACRGVLPGLGASFTLPALPGRLGHYLALTGLPIDAPLAYRVGWLTHRVPASEFPAIIAALSRAEPVDALLDGLDAGPVASLLDQNLQDIERCFSAASAGEIIARLEAIPGANAAWGVATAAAMRAVRPDVMEAVFSALTSGTQPSLRLGLLEDFRVANREPGSRGEEDQALMLPVPKPPSIS